MQSSRHVQTTNGENHFFSFLHSLFMVFPIKSEVFERFFFFPKKIRRTNWQMANLIMTFLRFLLSLSLNEWIYKSQNQALFFLDSLYNLEIIFLQSYFSFYSGA